MYFTGDDGYQIFLVFAPILYISLKLDSNRKVTNWMSIRISSTKIKLFDTNLEPNISNLGNSRVILKFINPVLVLLKFFFIV